jgi:hypothetical protein
MFLSLSHPTTPLQYTDQTPADYEPEFFTASDGSISAIAERFSLKINIGNIKTPSLDMKVKYCGLESLLFDDLAETGQSHSRIASVKSESVFSGTNFSGASNEAMHGTNGTMNSPLTETMQRLAVTPLEAEMPESEEKTPEDTPADKVKKFM